MAVKGSTEQEKQFKRQRAVHRQIEFQLREGG
jgi:hypothetical protein